MCADGDDGGLVAVGFVVIGIGGFAAEVVGLDEALVGDQFAACDADAESDAGLLSCGKVSEVDKDRSASGTCAKLRSIGVSGVCKSTSIQSDGGADVKGVFGDLVFDAGGVGGGVARVSDDDGVFEDIVDIGDVGCAGVFGDTDGFDGGGEVGSTADDDIGGVVGSGCFGVVGA